jgi:hypothetical protein
MESLKKYLAKPVKERDYWEGVKLYDKLGSDVRLKLRVFPRGPFQGNKDTLNYELEKIVSGSKSQISGSKKEVAPAAKKPEKKKKVRKGK